MAHRARGTYPRRGRLRNTGMDETHSTPAGLYDPRYLAFLETISQLRPRLHRYCSRMVGSVLDGEDIVQDALFQAYRKLDEFDETRPLAPWLFRIAHNQCVDSLRRRRVRRAAEAEARTPEWVVPEDPLSPDVGRALERLVLTLPPKERACVLLKDVFDYSLEEIAELVGSTVGGVKAALKRGRSKLAAPGTPRTTKPRAHTEHAARLRDLYIDRFNRRDWDGVRELIATDARVVVVDRYTGPVEGAPYFGRYARVATPWRIAVGEVDGEPVLLVLERGADVWTPQAIVRLATSGQSIQSIVDYTHCPWVLTAAETVRVLEPSSRPRIPDSSSVVIVSEDRRDDE